MYRKKLLSTDDFSYYRKRSIIHDSDDDMDTFKFDSVNNFVDIEDMDEDKDKEKMAKADAFIEVDNGDFYEDKNMDGNLADNDEHSSDFSSENENEISFSDEYEFSDAVGEDCDENDNYDYDRLFENSEISLFEACLLLLTFKFSFNLSNECFIALLKLIKILLPYGNKLPTTIDKIKHKNYCPECLNQLEFNSCSYNLCVNFRKIIKSPSMFHSISIKNQLSSAIKFFFKQIVDHKSTLKDFMDITNSNHYLHVNQVDNIINLMCYTDGVALKNNKTTFWPVFLSICDLPLILRDSRLNKIIAG